MRPGVIVIFSAVIIIVLGDSRKPPSDKIYFFHGISDLQDLHKFMNSRLLAARGTVFLEHAPPHRLVMGRENSTFDIRECFEAFEVNRDQQALFLTFSKPALLDRALKDYLVFMNRFWLYVHFSLFQGPPPSLPTNFTTDMLFDYMKVWPTKIRLVLGFSENNSQDRHYYKDTPTEYTPEQLKIVYDLLTNFSNIGRTVAAVQFEAVHVSQSEYFLNERVITPLQDLLLRAPLALSPNTAEINFNRLIKICRKFGSKQMIYDVNAELRDKLTKEPDYDLDSSRRLGGGLTLPLVVCLFTYVMHRCKFKTIVEYCD